MSFSFKKLTLLGSLLCIVFISFAQRGPGISLQVTHMDSLDVDLSWNTPLRAVSCEITYETSYSLTVHPITNFTLGTTQIPRANPIGAFEKFTIEFTMPDSSIKGDTVINNATYGGIVLVEDDVFAATVINDCFDTPTDAEAYYFVDACIVCDLDIACKISAAYLNENSIPADDPQFMLENIDPDIYKQFVLDSLYALQAMSSPSTSDCDGIFPEDGTARFGNLSTVEDIFTVSPNPFSNTILIKTGATHTVLEGELIVTSLHGKIILQRSYTDAQAQGAISLDTQGWSSGIYVLTIIADGEQESYKLAKN